jgi:ankyrin repeat protein
MTTLTQTAKSFATSRLGVLAVAMALMLAAGCASAPEAAATGDVTELTRLLSSGEVRATDRMEGGNTLLHAAASGGHVDSARLLLERGADVNAANAQGATALHVACVKRHAPMVAWLLAHGAEESLNQSLRPDAWSGASPLILAVGRTTRDEPTTFTDGLGHFIAGSKKVQVLPDAGIAEMLLRAGANPNAPPTAAGNTALHLAAYWQRPDLVELLLSYGADPAIRNKGGLLPRDMTTHAPTLELLRTAARP